MDLRTFVAESLVQIVEGVVASAERISAAGGAVSPAYDPNGASAAIGTTPAERKPVYLVEFDIAVTVTADTAKQASESLSVAGVGGKTSTSRESAQEQTANRLKFAVPVQLPMDPSSQAALEQRQRRSTGTRARIGGHMGA